MLARLIATLLFLLYGRRVLAPVRNLKGRLRMSTVTLNWSAPAPVAPNPTDVLNIQIWNQVSPDGGIPANVMIGTVAPSVTTFTTGTLAPGVHNFTAVAVYGEGSAVPSNPFTATVVVVLAPVTDLTGTVNS